MHYRMTKRYAGLVLALATVTVALAQPMLLCAGAHAASAPAA